MAMMQEVNDESLYMGSIKILIGHNHHVPVAEFLCIRVRLYLNITYETPLLRISIPYCMMLKPNDLFQVLNFFVVRNRRSRTISDV